MNNLWSHRLRERTGRLSKQDAAYAYKRRVGDWIREKRMARGLTQAELSELVDVFFTMISAIETGRNSVPPERYKAFAKALRVPDKEFGMKMVRWSNPWAYEMIFGADEELKAEIEMIPERIQRARGNRAPG